mgnify:CR=1 FL=1
MFQGLDHNLLRICDSPTWSMVHHSLVYESVEHYQINQFVSTKCTETTRIEADHWKLDSVQCRNLFKDDCLIVIWGTMDGLFIDISGKVHWFLFMGKRYPFDNRSDHLWLGVLRRPVYSGDSHAQKWSYASSTTSAYFFPTEQV